MALTHGLKNTPGGTEIVFMNVAGRVEGPEVDQCIAKMEKNGPYSGARDSGHDGKRL